MRLFNTAPLHDLVCEVMEIPHSNSSYFTFRGETEGGYISGSLLFIILTFALKTQTLYIKYQNYFTVVCY